MRVSGGIITLHNLYEAINLENLKVDKNKRKLRPLTVLIAGFLAVILTGTLLLMLPLSSASGEVTDPITAGFTAVSATCVTGLTTVETGAYWSVFGQIVILCMIQVGGLGFMTMAVLLSLIIRRNISPRERMIVAMSYNLNDYGSTVKLVRRILLGTVGFELLGAALLAIRFIPKFGTGRGIYMSVFHSISAFCNAGFDILGNGNSMGDYYGDPLVCLTLMALISIGGIGFIVWGDLVNFRTRRKLSVYSKFVLILTAVFTVLGTAYVAISEWNNPLTIGNYSVGEKLLCSAFQSVTWRTAGFATVDQASLHGATKIFGGIMMFIGGASGSTAGGVKVATVGILVLTVMSVSVGKTEINLFKRRVPSGVILRAMTLVSIQLLLIFVATLLCNVVSSAPLIDLFYEVVSAGGTVGLTASLTPTLHPFALVVLMCMMFFGRLGILTITLAIATRSSERAPSVLTYPDANILIG